MAVGAGTIAPEGRWCSAGAAAANVRDGDSVVVSGCGAAPLEFLQALALRADLSHVTVSHATAWGALPHIDSPDANPHLKLNAYFLPERARDLHAAGAVDYTPMSFMQMKRLFADGTLPVDVAVATTTRPDRNGDVSLGPFLSYMPAAFRQARLRVAECSDSFPFVRGRGVLPSTYFDALIEVSRAPIASDSGPTDATAKTIARHVASLVEDGDTLQIGRGAIPSAVAQELTRKRDLGVHSEMISDWIIDLARSGALTGRAKNTNPGLAVTSFMDGSKALYRFAHARPDLEMQPIYDVNDPCVISREPNFVALNSAVEVDLSGQINAESISGRLLGGSGGILDFAIGASLASNGRFIIAMPSTALDGTISRIVPSITEGSVVTVPRTFAHYIVTEHGVCDLRGASSPERARRLIAIAHPSFRSKLERSVLDVGVPPTRATTQE